MSPAVAMTVGGLIALCVFGLPLGIIGLFIVSILDRRSMDLSRSHRASPAPASKQGSQPIQHSVLWVEMPTRRNRSSLDQSSEDETSDATGGIATLRRRQQSS
jgi:hypothetical protein